MDENQQTPLASRWSRIGAALIDTLILMAVLLPLAYVMSSYTGVVEFSESAFTNAVLTELAFQFLFCLSALGAYCLVNWKQLDKTGQTIGKKVLKIKVVDSNGQPSPVKKLVFLRYGLMLLISYIPLLGALITLTDLLMMLGSEKRALHDRIANTIVVKA